MRRVRIVEGLVLHACYVVTARAATCAAPPLLLPIRAVSIAPGTISRGIPIFIGTPPQQIAFTPSLQLDNTFVPRYTNSCIDEARAANYTRWEGQDASMLCAELYGGGFYPSLSSTFHDMGTNEQIEEEWFRRLKYLDWHFITESFSLADYFRVYVEQNGVAPGKNNLTTRFMLPDEGTSFGSMGSSALGLAPKSTLLRILYEQSVVPSRSWSLTNVSLCLGCVDEGAYTGNVHTLKPSDRGKADGLPCVLQMKVQAIDYHADAVTGGVALIDKAFAVCIDPGVTFLVLPSDTRQRLLGVFSRNMEATFDDHITFKGPTENGNSILAFRFDGGLNVNVTIPGAGNVNAGESAERSIPIGKGGWGAYGEDVPVLGKPFTDSVVLRWDDIAQEYGISNANPHRSEKANTKLLGCDEIPSVQKFVKATSSSSVIIACLLGGFAGGLLFAMAGIFAFKRGRKSVNSQYESMRGDDVVSLRPLSVDGRTKDSTTSGILRLPAVSLRRSLQSHYSAQSLSPMLEPQLADDSQVFEAPEGEIIELPK